jgi:hypothetical protein
MKKIKFLFLGSILMLLFANASFAQSSNEGYYTGKATATLNSCLAEARQSGLIVNSFVITDETSCTTTVEFYGRINCPGNMLCPQVIYPVGSVTFDCNGNVVSSNCGNVVTL